MTTIARAVTGGVDTHLDVHVAAALDERGALLGTESFATTPRGYEALLAWLQSFGTLELIGIEGTGSYGAGLTRHLHRHGVAVVEVDRPNRQKRRRQGKSDTLDAVSAARAAQGGDANGLAKTRTGNVEAMLSGPRLLSHSLCECELLSVKPGLDELDRAEPAVRAMRPVDVVVDAPVRQEHLGLEQGVEALAVEVLVA
jgi:hypothetical protein